MIDLKSSMPTRRWVNIPKSVIQRSDFTPVVSLLSPALVRLMCGPWERLRSLWRRAARWDTVRENSSNYQDFCFISVGCFTLNSYKICKERRQDISNMIGLLGLIHRGRFDDDVARETRQDMVLLALCVLIELETTS